MAFSLGDDDNQTMSEMNLIPLIDIMLVLMIIFLVTATVLNPTVPLQLPNTTAQVNELPNEIIQISIDDKGQIFWDSEPVSLESMTQKMQQSANSDNPPSVHLRADKNGKYDTVAQVLASASTAGLPKIAFVSE